MAISKNDILIEWIKQLDTDVPSDEFTATLMDQLQTNVEINLASDEGFSDLVNLPQAELPLSNFTEGIISQLEPKKALINYRPIISKKVGGVFAMTMLVLVCLSLVTNTGSQINGSNSSGFEPLNITFSKFIELFSQESTPVILCLLSISILLSIDYIYKKRYL